MTSEATCGGEIIVQDLTLTSFANSDFFNRYKQISAFGFSVVALVSLLHKGYPSKQEQAGQLKNLMKQQRKSQVSSGGRGPGFALLLAKVLTNGLREWQRNAGVENKKSNAVIVPAGPMRLRITRS